jgi:hypothetical protein
VCDDVSSDGFGGVLGKAHTVRVRYHLCKEGSTIHDLKSALNENHSDSEMTTISILENISILRASGFWKLMVVGQFELEGMDLSLNLKYLVGEDDGDTELLGDPRQLPKEPEDTGDTKSSCLSLWNKGVRFIYPYMHTLYIYC